MSERERALELRSYWRIRRPVHLTLSDDCIVGTVNGMVQKVSVTGAFAFVDGWHIPCSKILRVEGDPTIEP